MGAHRDWPSLVVRPTPSPRLAGFVGLSHAIALGTLWTLPFGVHTAAASVLVLVSAIHTFYADVLRRAPWSVSAAVWQADGSWLLKLVSGREMPARLMPSTFVSVPLTVLVFSVGRWRRLSLPLLADSLDADVRRRLRQRLRIQGDGSISALESA